MERIPEIDVFMSELSDEIEEWDAREQRRLLVVIHDQFPRARELARGYLEKPDERAIKAD
jgi:hypothetical protein